MRVRVEFWSRERPDALPGYVFADRTEFDTSAERDWTEEIYHAIGRTELPKNFDGVAVVTDADPDPADRIQGVLRMYAVRSEQTTRLVVR